MKHFTKRMLALLLMISMIFSLFPAVAMGADEPQAEVDWITAEEDALVQADILDSIDSFFSASAKRSSELTLSDYVEATDDIMELVIASETYLEDSIVERGDGFFWQTTAGITCGYFPEDRYKADQQVATKSVNTSALANWNYDKAGKNDVCLIAPMYSEDTTFTDQYTKEALAIAEATGGTAYGLIDETADVNTIAQAIEKCGVVIFDSHGGTDWQVFYGGSDGNGEADNTSEANTSYIWLSSGDGMTSADCAYVQGTYGRYPHAYKDTYGNYLTDGTAIANHMSKNSENCILWMAICLGMATDGMCAPLRAKGVPVIYGYSQSVTFYGDYKYEEVFWDNMIDGSTVAEAISAMKSKYGSWDPYYKNYTQSNAIKNYVAFPIVVSDEDAYPGQGKVDAIQTVKSSYKLLSIGEPVTVTLSTPNGTTLQQGLSGTAMNLPTMASQNGYSFVGWTAEPIEEETTQKPTIYTDSYTPHESITLYALFSRTDSSGSNAPTEYILTDISSIAPDDKVVITVTYDSETYALSSLNGSSSAPEAIPVSVYINKLSQEPAQDLLWNIGGSEGAYVIYPDGNHDNWLYCNNTNNGVRVGTASNNTFTIKNDYLYNNSVNRYLGVYLNNPDWRCYTGTSGNIVNQVLGFYVKGNGSETYYTTNITTSCKHTQTYESVIAATCTENGVVSTICTHCEAVISTQVLEALGHNQIQTSVTNATCTENGSETYTCTVCGDSYQDVIEALGHNYVNGICSVCGDQEPSEPDYSGRYYFAGIRSTDTYYHYIMGVMDGSRYDIENSGLTELPDKITTPEADKIFVVEKNSDGTYRIYAEGISDSAKYLGWTSGNSGTFVAESKALSLTIDLLDSGLYNIHFKASDAERYLSLNGTAANTYAAWYKTGQTKDLALIPVASGTEAHVHSVAYFEGQPATCTQDGVLPYYYCSLEDCPDLGKCYYDQVLTISILQEDLVDPATGHNMTYSDNGDGEHTYACSNGCTLAVTVEGHSYIDGLCLCGAKEPATPGYEYDENLSLSMSISVGAEMQVMYSALRANVQDYQSFYFEVIKEVVGGESITTVFSLDAGNLEEKFTPTGTLVGYSATYTGIFAMEMGDNFSATLYAVAEDGNIHYGNTVTSSIKTYLMQKLTDATSSAELKTLAVDMLNYGAAAQVNFNYDAENLVNADLTDEQKALGTQGIADASDGSSISGDGAMITAGVSLQSKVILYANCAYASDEGSNLKFVIKNAKTGDILQEIEPSLVSSRICQGVYDNVGAAQMRELITIELYDNGVLVSQTLTWSIESYVAQTRASSTSSEALIETVNAMLIYGDSAAVYLAFTNQ